MMKEAQENDSGLLSFYVDRSGSETFSGKKTEKWRGIRWKRKTKKTPNYANTVKRNPKRCKSMPELPEKTKRNRQMDRDCGCCRPPYRSDVRGRE